MEAGTEHPSPRKCRWTKHHLELAPHRKRAGRTDRNGETLTPARLGSQIHNMTERERERERKKEKKTTRKRKKDNDRKKEREREKRDEKK